MLMLMPENVMIMMVVRRPGWDRKPHIPNVYYTIFFFTRLIPSRLPIQFLT